MRRRKTGSKRSISGIQRRHDDPDYVSLLEDSGIVCISAPCATAVMVENYLNRPQVADLLEIERGVANVIDMKVPEGGSVVGRMIQDIDIPEQCVVTAIIRTDTFVGPRRETDIFLGASDAIQTAPDIFSADAETTA